MNHQVEHHADVHATGRERREPVRLDEARLAGGLAQVLEDRVEALDVADLQHAVVALGQAHQLGRPVGVVRHRLFDKKMFALLEQRLGQGVVRDRRRDDAQRIGRPGGILHRVQRHGAVFRGDRLGQGVVGVVHADQLDGALPVHFTVNSRMLPAKRTNAQHGHPDPSCHARSLPVAWPSGEEISLPPPSRHKPCFPWLDFLGLWFESRVGFTKWQLRKKN